MHKAVIVVILIIIVTGLFWWINSRESVPQTTPVTNSEILKTQSETAILIESDVAYVPDARGYFVRPEADGAYPGVVMIHENRGLRPEIRATAEQLAKEGYLVLAVDLLGATVETQDEARALTAEYDQEKGIENMRAAAAFLKEHGAAKVASLGWCFGGAQSLQLALSGEPLDATVIYYGRLATTTEALAPITWPVLGIFAGEDQTISVESVNQFKASLDALSVPNEIHIYPGVKHAFANPSGMNYAPEETKDAWEKTLMFLFAHLH